jgi:hypothetical protein
MARVAGLALAIRVLCPKVCALNATVILSEDERKFLRHYVAKILTRQRGALESVQENLPAVAQRKEVADLQAEIARLQALLDKLTV